MFFNKSKKNKDKEKCPDCKSGLEKEFSFCPYCGLSLVDKEQEMKKYGLLGKNEFEDRTSANTMLAQEGFGFSDKIFSTIFNSLMKNMEKQMRQAGSSGIPDLSNAEVRPVPGGFSIKISNVSPGMGGKIPNSQKIQAQKPQRQTARKVSSEQLNKISSMPRISAKSNVKRLGNKIVYELGIEGVKSPDDIFVSKLEKGYEIKAIGDKHVYVNTIPLDLPVKTFKLDKDKITFEFKTGY
jgi:hypothetical protein